MESGVERKDETASDDIRTRRKQAKLQKKLEKKNKKEEEFLKDFRKPKDTKVVLADRNFLEKLPILKNGRPSARSFELSSLDFPELSPSTPPRKPHPAKMSATHRTAAEQSNPNAVVPPIGENLNAESSPQTEKAIVPGVSEPEKPPANAAVPTPTLKDKGTKKKDPIVLNLGDLIVNKPPKKSKKQLITPGMKHRRMLETNTLCGNMLDSSNPKRSRGKHRETEKRTLTKLKLAIVRDRIMSLKAKEEDKSWVEEMDREIFRNELHLYLNDLMEKLKITKAEKTSKVNKMEESDEMNPEDDTGEPAKEVKKKKLSKYRKYCDNAYSEELDRAVNVLIRGIVYLQDRAFGRNPIKAKAKPRHVVGLREVKKCLMLHKVKMVIVAPDLEAQETVFKTIEELKNCAYMQNVPCVFAMNRRQLGYASKKFVPVSAFGLLSYDGLEDKFAAVKEKLKEAQDIMKISQPVSEAPSDDSNIPA